VGAHAVAEFRRMELEKRFASRKVESEMQRFELSPGKYDITKFLTEHAGQ
jgi:DNA-binding response OmpR family regulator